MKTKDILYILLIGILVTSCEKTIDFKGGITEPMLVVSSFITPDSVVKATLSKSDFFLDKGYDYRTVSNADFSLFVNGVEKSKLVYTGNGLYQSEYKPAIGDEIKIEVKAAEFKSVTSHTKIPDQLTIISVDTISTVEKGYWVGNEGGYYNNNNMDTTGEYIYRKLNFRIKFKDNDTEKNYYRLLVKKHSYINNEVIESYLFNFEDIIFGNRQSQSSIGNLFNSGNNNYSYDTFSDDLINGKEYELKFSNISIIESKDYKNPGTTTKQEIRSIYFIYLQQISSEYYMYAKSSSKARNIDDNPFMEPVQIHSNIQNGIGIFGSYTSSPVKVIDVKQ